MFNLNVRPGLILRSLILLADPNVIAHHKGNDMTPFFAKEVKAVVTEVCYKVNINTLHKQEDDLTLYLNDIGRIKVRTSAPLIADSYKSNRITGSFVLIDELTNATVAAGMII